MDEKKIRRLTRFEAWKKYSTDSVNYAVERFDLMIIAIATTGIIIDLNIIKSAIEFDMNINPAFEWLIKGSTISFALGIVFNFVSHLTAKKAYGYEEKWAEEVIRGIEEDNPGDKEKDKKIKELRSKADTSHPKTKWMNRLSIIFASAGFLLLIFVVLIFL